MRVNVSGPGFTIKKIFVFQYFYFYICYFLFLQLLPCLESGKISRLVRFLSSFKFRFFFLLTWNYMKISSIKIYIDIFLSKIMDDVFAFLLTKPNYFIKIWIIYYLLELIFLGNSFIYCLQIQFYLFLVVEFNYPV